MDFRHGGIQLPTAGGPVANVNRARLLAELVKEGAITMSRSRSVKVPRIRLSDAAEDRGRALVGLTSICGSWHWLGELSRLAGGKVGQVVSECRFTDRLTVA